MLRQDQKNQKEVHQGSLKKKVTLKKCGISIDVNEQNYKPNDFIKFSPSSIEPECVDDQGKKDDSCEKWLSESLKLVNEKISSRSNITPLELRFEGHTNSISNNVLINMMYTKAL